MARRTPPCPDCGGRLDHSESCTARLAWLAAQDLDGREDAARRARARLISAVVAAREKGVPQTEIARLIGKSKRAVQLMEQEGIRAVGSLTN